MSKKSEWVKSAKWSPNHKEIDHNIKRGIVIQVDSGNKLLFDAEFLGLSVAQAKAILAEAIEVIDEFYTS